jgi:hypothetical protein
VVTNSLTQGLAGLKGESLLILWAVRRKTNSGDNVFSVSVAGGNAAMRKIVPPKASGWSPSLIKN